MSLTLVEVEHIAELARLSLTDAEKGLYCDQLSAILDYAAILQQVDTSAISPTASVPPGRASSRGRFHLCPGAAIVPRPWSAAMSRRYLPGSFRIMFRP